MYPTLSMTEPNKNNMTPGIAAPIWIRHHKLTNVGELWGLYSDNPGLHTRGLSEVNC